MRIIAGESRGRRIEAPSGKDTRPTLDRVRENLFNIIRQDIQDARVLDLFAGSGALSLEALSRGAASAVMVDADRKASRVQQKNIALLGYGEKTKVYTCDWRSAVRMLRQESFRFDLVFLDPPYRMTGLQEVFDGIAPLITAESKVIYEHEAKQPFAMVSGFQCIKDRSWGYCSISIYQSALHDGQDLKEEV